MRSRDDATLLGLYARKGDEAAFRELARHYGALVYSACLKDVRRPELAEDAAQAVFLALARQAGRIRIATTLVPWLYAASRLASRNVLRAERRRPTIALNEDVPAPEADSDDALFQALDALGSPDREAIVLRFVQGMSLAEVGRAQGISEDAARMRVQRALKRLRTDYVPGLAVPASFDIRLAALDLPRPLPLMKILLLLTACGVVVATGAALAATRQPNRPAIPSRRTTIATAQARPFDESKLKLAKPGPPPPKIATLDRPFTLVYTLRITDLRTESMREAAIADRRRQLAKQVDDDRKTQAQADKEIIALRALELPRTETITLAYNGKTLFYEDAPGGEKPRPNINLFDGAHSYNFRPEDSGGKFGSQGRRHEGTVQETTSNMPYIGPSLPFFPVTRGKEILVLTAIDRKLVYRPFGTITPGPQGAIGSLRMGRFDPQDTIVLSRWMPLQGRSVAGSIVRTDYGYWTYLAPEDVGKLARRYEYTLVSARPSADPARFSPAAYAQDGMTFSLDGGRRHFEFDPTRGSLNDQIAAIGGSGR